MNSANREEKKYNPEDITINGETWLSCSCGHHFVIDGIIARVKSQTRNDLLREIMEEMPKKIDEVIVGAFLDVAGTVWGIDAPDRRWTDKQMTYFNVKIVEIRDKTIDQVNTILERKLLTDKK